MAKMLAMNAESLKKYRFWLMIYGIACIVLGAVAIVMPNLATTAVEMTIGWLLVIGGVMGLIAAFSAGAAAPGFWWNLLVAILYLLAGIALLWHPVAGTVTLTLILTAYLIAGGVIKAMMAFNMRRLLPKAWLWMLLSGLVDLVLAGLILSGWPGSAGWVIGLLVGINLLMTGIALVVASIYSRNIEQISVEIS